MRSTGRARYWLRALILSVVFVQYASPCGAVIFPPCECGGTPTAIQIDIWLDPGHDPVNKGNHGLNLDPAPPNEEEVTWTITNDLSNVLLNAGYCALLTRTNYTTVYSPRQHAGIAGGRCFNDNGDQAFGQGMVSIHTNSGPPNRLGTTTVYPSQKDCARHAPSLLDDQAFANDLQVAMAPQMRLAYVGACSPLPCSDNLGICPSNSLCSPKHKSAIEEATIPAVIVEVGFQTNPCQECHMRVQPGVIATAVAAGIYNTFITPTACIGAAHDTTVGADVVVPKKPRASTSALLSPRPRNSGKRANSNRILSFNEGFEGATFPPTGWTVQTSGAPAAYAWARTTSPFYVASGTGAGFIGGGYTSAKDEWLISPATVLGAGDTGLQFNWVGNRNFASEVDVQLLVRPSAGGSWTTLWSLISEPYGNVFTVKTATVSLAAFTGQSIEFAFRSVGTNGADFAVDEVSIGAYQVSQPPNNDHCANASQLPHGSFSISASTCNATNDMDPSDGTTSACIGYQMFGPDVFYFASGSAGDTLEASVQSLWGAGLYVMSSCNGAPANCLAGEYFEDGELDPTVRVVFSQLTNYFLVVDGASENCGDFQLTGRVTGPTVGVDAEAEQSLGLKITPNPMVSRARIVGSFRQVADGTAKLTITDVQGRRVLHRDLPLGRGRVAWEWNRQSADGKRVAPGIYVIELRSGEESLRSRVVVSR